jgi:hypothetical protein
MADPKDKENEQQPPAPPVNELAVLRAELEALKAAVNVKAAAQAQVEAQAEKAAETIPGGAYLLADGKTLVNAYGRKIDKTGKPLSNDDASLEQIVIVR